MFIHDVNTSHVCWQRAETMEVTFQDPNDMSNTEMILPFCLSAIFFIPSCLFIPAFMKQDSSAARLLDRMGIKHAPDHDQVRTLSRHMRTLDPHRRYHHADAHVLIISHVP